MDSLGFILDTFTPKPDPTPLDLVAFLTHKNVVA
jgi:hypothetical protein